MLVFEYINIEIMIDHNNKNYLLISTVLFLAVFLFSGCGDYSDREGDYESSSSEAETFNGYDCTSDCSGHEAGYNWAERKGITDPGNCGGNSRSFIEGCQSYAEEQLK